MVQSIYFFFFSKFAIPSMLVRLNITAGCVNGMPCEDIGVMAAGRCTVADSWPCASADWD